jgi:hypothetical protein
VEFIEAPAFTAHLADYLGDDEYGGCRLFSRATRTPAMSFRGLVVSGS